MRLPLPDLVNEPMRSHIRGLATDDTGLKGKYDFMLTYSRPRADMPPSEMPDWVSNPPDLPEPIPALSGPFSPNWASSWRQKRLRPK
jgi:hypothetical protein